MAAIVAECRPLAARSAASQPCPRVQVLPRAFTHSPAFRSMAVNSADVRAQRASVTAKAIAAPADAEEDTYEKDDSFQERVVQVRRVTKVVKGGKQLRFRAVVVVGDENGQVGVGCASAKEVLQAVRKAVTDAKRNVISVPLNKASSFPHRFDGVFGSARVMLRPAAEGTGVIAGGAVRVVLELAGVKNAFGKQLGSDNPMNNAKATVEGLRNMRTFEMVAAARGVTLEHLLPPRK